MNRKTYWSILCVILIAALSACGGGNSTPPPPPAEAITVTSGSGQTAVVNTAFAAPLVATVATGGTPNSGVVVTFTAPSSGASGTFGSGATTATATTDSNGVATSPTFTANGTTGGPYTVTASAAGVTAPANFSLTNTAVVASNFSFYLSGLETANDGPSFYALAGAVTIDANGNVLQGEQDYNDAFEVTSPQPSGDSITGGTLSVDPTTGQGQLTLITNNALVGVAGTETLGVQFVNASHALIIQFDGTATSSGSIDLQTLPSTLSGGFAFTLTGEDPSFNTTVSGGVFTISGTSLSNGIFDVNDAGDVTTDTTFTGTLTALDSFGRGTITGTGLAITLNYYVIGPEAIRIIDVDTTDTAVGSAFGQGAAAGNFDNSSITGQSVFGVQANADGFPYSAAGQFTAGSGAVTPAVRAQGVPLQNSVTGVGDDDEAGDVISAMPISGLYSISGNGYGNLSIGTGSGTTLGDVSFLGIYMVDPNINITDPNNTTSGLGGALVTDLDSFLVGTGVLIPQTGPTDAFSGTYAFGALVFNPAGELDFLGQGSIADDGTFSGTGLISDPQLDLTVNSTDIVTFAGSVLPDGVYPGRNLMTDDTAPLSIFPATGSSSLAPIVQYQVVVYEASAGQSLWIEEDDFSLFGGSLQQQGSLNGIPQPAAKKAAAKAKPKQK